MPFLGGRLCSLGRAAVAAAVEADFLAGPQSLQQLTLNFKSCHSLVGISAPVAALAGWQSMQQLALDFYSVRGQAVAAADTYSIRGRAVEG